MDKGHFILSYVGGLKTDNDNLQYSVESNDGGGCEFTSESLEEAKDYIKNIGSFLTEVL